jgi:hypothetical protein
MVLTDRSDALELRPGKARLGSSRVATRCIDKRGKAVTAGREANMIRPVATRANKHFMAMGPRDRSRKAKRRLHRDRGHNKSIHHKRSASAGARLDICGAGSNGTLTCRDCDPSGSTASPSEINVYFLRGRNLNLKKLSNV